MSVAGIEAAWVRIARYRRCKSLFPCLASGRNEHFNTDLPQIVPSPGPLCASVPPVPSLFFSFRFLRLCVSAMIPPFFRSPLRSAHAIKDRLRRC